MEYLNYYYLGFDLCIMKYHVKCKCWSVGLRRSVRAVVFRTRFSKIQGKTQYIAQTNSRKTEDMMTPQ